MELIWSEHLADISRALKTVEDAKKELDKGFGVSDLEFKFPERIQVTLGGMDTNLALVYENDSFWALEVRP